MSNFEAVNQAVEMAKERKAHGFFYREQQDGTHIVGFY